MGSAMATEAILVGPPNPAREDWTESSVIVAHQIGRCRLPREDLDNLLRQPFCGRMSGHRKPKQLTPSVADNDEGKQALEVHSWHHAQVNRSDCLRMVAQECPPVLGGRTPSAGHVFGHRRLGKFKPRLEQFTMNAGSAHNGFSWLIRRIRSRSSRSIRGRPADFRDFQRQ